MPLLLSLVLSLSSSEAFIQPQTFSVRSLQTTNSRLQASPSSILEFNSLLVAENDSVGGLMDAVTSSTSGLTEDPAILIAGTVAFLCGFLILALQFMNSDGEQKEESAVTKSSDSAVSVVSMDSEEEQDVVVTNVEEEADSEEKGDETDTSSTGSSSTADEEEETDLTPEEYEALAAFQEENRAGLRAVLSKLVDKIRVARASLLEQTALREEAEAELKVLAEEIRTLEDKYELEQNVLEKKKLQLKDTMNTLNDTRDQLQATQESLSQLEQERKSLKKLGQAAWQLSKERVQTRISKIRKRIRGTDRKQDDTDEPRQE